MGTKLLIIGKLNELSKNLRSRFQIDAKIFIIIITIKIEPLLFKTNLLEHPIQMVNLQVYKSDPVFPNKHLSSELFESIQDH